MKIQMTRVLFTLSLSCLLSQSNTYCMQRTFTNNSIIDKKKIEAQKLEIKKQQVLIALETYHKCTNENINEIAATILELGYDLPNVINGNKTKQFEVLYNKLISISLDLHKKTKKTQRPKTKPKKKIVKKDTPKKKQPEKKENKDCVICLCEKEKDQECQMLVCGHTFHTNCINKWLVTKNTCPLCNKSIDELEEQNKKRIEELEKEDTNNSFKDDNDDSDYDNEVFENPNRNTNQQQNNAVSTSTEEKIEKAFKIQKKIIAFKKAYQRRPFQLQTMQALALILVELKGIGYNLEREDIYNPAILMLTIAGAPTTSIVTFIKKLHKEDIIKDHINSLLN